MLGGVAQFDLDFGGATALERLEISLPAIPGATDRTNLLLREVAGNAGDRAWMKRCG